MREKALGQEAMVYRDCLADVLKVWDCDAQAWVTEAPAILRFENEDVIVSPLSPKGHQIEASFLRENGDELLDAIAKELSGKDSCLCWRHWSIGAEVVGHELSVEELLGKI